MSQKYVKLLRSGQITIPKEIREAINGNLFVATAEGPEKIILQVIEIKEKKSSPNKPKFNPKEIKYSSNHIKKELEKTGHYKKEFIKDVYEGLKDYETGRSKKLKSSLFSL